jgi:fatty-acyl-CoA synthase
MKYWIDFLEKNATDFPSKIAIIDQTTKRRINYFDLNAEVDLWAGFLQSIGVKKNDPIAFLNSTNCLEHVTLMLACAKISAVFIPLNFRLSNNEIEEVLNRLCPKFYLGFGKKTLNCETNYLDIKNIDLNNFKSYHSEKSTFQDTILMLFTSGSTGMPKGVMFHGEMLYTNQKETCLGWGLLSTDVTLVETPFFHTGGYNVLLLPLLYLGGTVILASAFSADNVFKTIESENVTVYFGVPTMFQMLLDNEYFSKCNFKSIRFFISGGAACSIPMILEYQNIGLMFKQGFGLTEVGPNCFLLDGNDAILKSGSIGKPMPHSKVRVINKEGLDVKVDEVGELIISGPHVCAGYFNNPEAFSDTYKNNYFYTGDLVRFDSEGFYFVVGRIKDMYISGGENVYPGEVEKQITSHPSILDAVVVSVPSIKWGEVGFAFLLISEIKFSKNFTIDELRLFLNPLLSRYKHPHFMRSLSEFPLLPNGKIDRKFLKQEAQKIIS